MVPSSTSAQAGTDARDLTPSRSPAVTGFVVVRGSASGTTRNVRRGVAPGRRAAADVAEVVAAREDVVAVDAALVGEVAGALLAALAPFAGLLARLFAVTGVAALAVTALAAAALADAFAGLRVAAIAGAFVTGAFVPAAFLTGVFVAGAFVAGAFAAGRLVAAAAGAAVLAAGFDTGVFDGFLPAGAGAVDVLPPVGLAAVGLPAAFLPPGAFLAAGRFVAGDAFVLAVALSDVARRRGVSSSSTVCASAAAAGSTAVTARVDGS